MVVLVICERLNGISKLLAVDVQSPAIAGLCVLLNSFLGGGSGPKGVPRARKPGMPAEANSIAYRDQRCRVLQTTYALCLLATQLLMAPDMSRQAVPSQVNSNVLIDRFPRVAEAAKGA